MSYGTTTSPPVRADGRRSSDPLLQNGNNATGPNEPVDGSNTSDDVAMHSAGFRERAKSFCGRNIGLLFVFVAQIFASIMSMTTRLLATGFEVKFHALQIIFVRMLATCLFASGWMWFKEVPGFPWGPRGVRRLLCIRGTAGSIGLFGLYYSLSYLDVSDATVITFLVPTITAFVCWVALNEPFTIKEASASLIALAGVVFIARPGFLFSSPDNTNPDALSFGQSAAYGDLVLTGGILPPVRATPLERSIAVGCAILGAFCAATAYATIRVIGKRAHSLVSVNYFAISATLGSFLIIMIHPDLRFQVPTSPAQWILLISIGVSGFVFQIFMTEGLQREKAGRATNLIYTQLIFSLIIDYTVWGTTPPLTSLFGGFLIISAAIWISLQKKTTTPKRDTSSSDEERRLLDGESVPTRS